MASFTDPPALEPEDFYTEGGLIVLTAAYHLKRGSCCNSGCRHCPYDLEGAAQRAKEDTVAKKIDAQQDTRFAKEIC